MKKDVVSGTRNLELVELMIFMKPLIFLAG
jgi:hypothetical protein